MMHRAEAVHGRGRGGRVHDLDRLARRVAVDGDANAPFRFVHDRVAEQAGHQLQRLHRRSHDHRDAVQTADRGLGADPAARPRCPSVAIVGDELEHQARRIGHQDRFLAEPRRDILQLESALAQPYFPEIERPGGNRKRGRRDLPRAFFPNGHAVPLVGERGPERAGRAQLVAVIKVIDVMVVEVDGLLDEPQAKRLDAEIEILLCIVHRCRHVMEAENGRRHVDQF